MLFVFNTAIGLITLMALCLIYVYLKNKLTKPRDTLQMIRLNKNTHIFKKLN